MAMKPIQVNIKFINHLQPKWSKFVMDVKLAKDLYNTNFDHLYGYLRQHEAHANEVHQIRQRYSDPIALLYQPPDAHHSSVVHHQSYQSPAIHQPPQASFLPIDSGLPVPSFLPSYDPISSSGVRSSATGSSVNRNGGTYTAGPVKVIYCYNCQEEGHTARQCTKPKRLRNSAWFKEKAMLAEALELGVVLDEEHMALLADNGDTVTKSQESQEIPTLAVFQTDDLDAFDYDCDEAPSASAVLMAKLSAYDLDVVSEVPTHDTYLDNQGIDQSVQEM
ncbi:retrovirus-related pol polyprotein from transposon TNT 1-94 [Tanacetum coccineum]